MARLCQRLLWPAWNALVGAFVVSLFLVASAQAQVIPQGDGSDEDAAFWDPEAAKALVREEKAKQAACAYKEAIEDFTNALDFYPHSAETLAARAASHNALGAHERARMDANEALGFDPEFAPAFYELGWAFFGEGVDDEAKFWLNRAIELDSNPDGPNAKRAGLALKKLESGEPKAEAASDEPVNGKQTAHSAEHDDVFARSELLLLASAKEGHADAAKKLVEVGVDIDAADPRGWTPLMYAAANEQPKVVAEFLELGADPNVTSQDGLTALHMAVASNSKKIVESLVQAAADPNVPDKKGNTPLLLAVAADSSELVELLIAAGADPNLIPVADPNAVCVTNVPPLGVAIQKKANKTVEALIQAGADANATLSDGTTMLMLAVNQPDKKSEELVHTVVDGGAKIDAKNESGVTAFDIARSIEWDAVEKYLAGLSPASATAKPTGANNAPKPTAENVLGAIAKGDKELVSRLVHAPGFDPNATDSSGWTPS